MTAFIILTAFALLLAYHAIRYLLHWADALAHEELTDEQSDRGRRIELAIVRVSTWLVAFACGALICGLIDLAINEP